MLMGIPKLWSILPVKYYPINFQNARLQCCPMAPYLSRQFVGIAQHIIWIQGPVTLLFAYMKSGWKNDERPKILLKCLTVLWYI